MSQKNERFGRYLILDHLIDGGMAKISRARFLGEEVDRIVAIKVIKPQFSEDESFKTMFINELKTTFALSHSNIIQIYDYGIHNSQLYVAMEYCDGKNLKEYLDRLLIKRYVFPIEVSVHVVSQVCRGLHYAHTFTDKFTGKKANIVHRDISPHNVMVSYDGSVKIIDFGIAKAETNTDTTQAGTIKGKLSYLAPEYLEGHKLDHRYDQFATGIILWEMLCNRKLFMGDNDLGVLKKIQECKIPPPSSINPKVPKELDEIVLKALSKNRDDRYKDLDQLNRVLMKFLYTKYQDFNASDLQYFASELFKEDIKKDREKLFLFGKIDIAPYIADMKKENEKGDNSQENNDANTMINKSMDTVFEFDTKEFLKSVNQDKEAKKEMSGLAKPSKMQIDATMMDVKTTLNKRTVVRNRNARNIKNKKVVATEKFEEKKRGYKKWIFLLAAGLASFFYMEKQKENKESKAMDQIVKESKKNLIKRKIASLGEIELVNFKKNVQRLFINGKEVKVKLFENPKIPINQKVILRVQTPGREHFVRDIFLKSKASIPKITIEATPSAIYGVLQINGHCYEGKIVAEIFKEKQYHVVRGKDNSSSKLSIQFPIKLGENGNSIPTTHEIIYYKKGSMLDQKISFELHNEGDVVDFCELIDSSSRSFLKTP